MHYGGTCPGSIRGSFSPCWLGWLGRLPAARRVLCGWAWAMWAVGSWQVGSVVDGPPPVALLSHSVQFLFGCAPSACGNTLVLVTGPVSEKSPYFVLGTKYCRPSLLSCSFPLSLSLLSFSVFPVARSFAPIFRGRPDLHLRRSLAFLPSHAPS